MLKQSRWIPLLTLFCFLVCSEWDRFAKGEYERLAMEEEGGDDSEMIDAMDGWDSEDDSTAAQGADSTAASGTAGNEESKADWDIFAQSCF